MKGLQSLILPFCSVNLNVTFQKNDMPVASGRVVMIVLEFVQPLSEELMTVNTTVFAP